MPKLNVKAMMESISGLEPYIPAIENSNGVKYLYDRIYTPLLNGGALMMSDIDFMSFSLEDIQEFEEYYDSTLSIHSGAASFFIEKLKKLPPMYYKTGYI